MYSRSTMFTLSYEYAKLISDRIYVLSAKHELLKDDSVIEPYNLNLADLKPAERRHWAQNVILQLQEKCDLEIDEFTILAGKNYYQYLLRSLSNYSIPLEHVSLFNRPAALKQLIQNVNTNLKVPAQYKNIENSRGDVCDHLHALFNSMRRYTIQEIHSVPFDNGIYIVFEKGETYLNAHRIVRVGTHTSSNRLRQRLKDHFIRENKDGSIFRKNVGKAILTQQGSEYLDTWTLDTSKSENRKRVDPEIQATLEREVSRYFEQNMSFVVFPVEDQQQRLRIEEGIISSLNLAPDFKPNKNWLGSASPEEEIRDSGLWLKRGLMASPLTDRELLFIQTASGSGQPASQAAGKTKSAQSRSSSVISISNNTTLREGVRVSGTAEIREYIQKKFSSARARGEEFCTLVSGDIADALRIKNRMPSICGVMYSLMKSGDEILSTTPSGQSSTIKIKYYLK